MYDGPMGIFEGYGKEDLEDRFVADESADARYLAEVYRKDDTEFFLFEQYEEARQFEKDMWGR